MANHKSALKRARQSKVRRLKNLSFKTRVKNAVKDVRVAAISDSPDQAKEKLEKAVSIIQKTLSSFPYEEYFRACVSFFTKAALGL